MRPLNWLRMDLSFCLNYLILLLLSGVTTYDWNGLCIRWINRFRPNSGRPGATVGKPTSVGSQQDRHVEHWRRGSSPADQEQALQAHNFPPTEYAGRKSVHNGLTPTGIRHLAEGSWGSLRELHLGNSRGCISLSQNTAALTTTA